jgi:hypothetical protein
VYSPLKLMQLSNNFIFAFFSSSSPSQLDASLYSLLSIISILPAKGDSGLLRTTLDRCPRLTKWYKSHEP